MVVTNWDKVEEQKIRNQELVDKNPDGVKSKSHERL